MKLRPTTIPDSLKKLSQWIVWKTIVRQGKPTKVLFQLDGTEAKSNDSSTWSTFDAAWKRYEAGGYDGPGFVFDAADPFVGIDLDGCRDPKTRQVAEWAREVIIKANTYAEVSPSRTGLKLWAIGKSPFATGRNKKLLDLPCICDREAGIEIYDKLRYFAVTGWRLAGVPSEPQERDLSWIAEQFWPPEPPIGRQDWFASSTIVDRARRYMATMPPAVSGQGGHNATFHVACVLACGFGLSEPETLALLREYNHRCQPPWSERELAHKAKEAAKQPGERDYLRDKTPDEWKRTKVPRYVESPLASSVRRTTLVKATSLYLDQVASDKCGLLSVGLPEVDYALGGGVSAGEVVILAGRPSHGKSAFALQCIHHLSSLGLPAVLVSEEMSALALGKRTVQFAVDVHPEHWKDSADEVKRQLVRHFSDRAECRIVESCGTALRAAEEIKLAVKEIDAKVAAVDYAQLLRSPGKSEYEDVSNTSRTLRAVANETGVVLLMLCQMNRAIESRPKFVPQMRDLRGAGQLEQDADVILFLCWPHRLDEKRDAKEYLVFIGKNRNRPINENYVKCEFVPSRQSIVIPGPGGRRYAKQKLTAEEDDAWHEFWDR